MSRPAIAGLPEAISASVMQAGSKRVADLALEFRVSEVTVRRILDGLEQRGVIRRYHGEARPYDGDAIPFRMGVRYAEKRAIAELAASLVNEGDSICIEAGSAAACLAERLKSFRSLAVLTPNLFIARIFRGTKVRVALTGGSYQEESESLVGPLAVEGIRKVGFSLAFVGASGYSTAAGFALNDFARAEVTKAIVSVGAAVWVVTDSSKFGVARAATFCTDLSLLAGVVTDSDIPPRFRTELESAGLRVLSCKGPLLTCDGGPTAPARSVPEITDGDSGV
jgi:DeoR/GlpR family transcriptional regulator of sugar metabolism